MGCVSLMVCGVGVGLRVRHTPGKASGPARPRTMLLRGIFP